MGGFYWLILVACKSFLRHGLCFWAFARALNQSVESLSDKGNKRQLNVLYLMAPKFDNGCSFAEATRKSEMLNRINSIAQC